MDVHHMVAVGIQVVDTFGLAEVPDIQVVELDSLAEEMDSLAEELRTQVGGKLGLDALDIQVVEPDNLAELDKVVLVVLDIQVVRRIQLDKFAVLQYIQAVGIQ